MYSNMTPEEMDAQRERLHAEIVELERRTGNVAYPSTANDSMQAAMP